LPLHAFDSFPTRRSSDLIFGWLRVQTNMNVWNLNDFQVFALLLQSQWQVRCSCANTAWKYFKILFEKQLCQRKFESYDFGTNLRSEEHTSELQSRFDLVC